MKNKIIFVICALTLGCMAVTCKKQGSVIINPPADSSLVNLAHLNYLYTPVTFSNGTATAGIYIYAEAPDYHVVDDADEGFTCVDDVARAALVYMRSSKFATDTVVQNKAYNLIRFVLEMQSGNGYFYNFLYTNMEINKFGPTSINTAQWWSWRALQALSEASPLFKINNPELAVKVDAAVNKLVAVLKTDQVNIPQITKNASGITVPQWLPAGSGTDQAAIIILGLLPYCAANNDAVINNYVKKLADGIAMMQQGDASHFPYSCFLSWENTWHAYACDQAYAMMKAGLFFNDQNYIAKGMAEVDNFYPWLLQNGMKSSFIVSKNGDQINLASEKTYEQIAYGIRPMVFAAAEAFKQTGQIKYADIAGHLAAWFFGANDGSKTMYQISTGRGYDGLQAGGSVNMNSGAESTIEALMTMQIVEKYSEIRTAMNKYKK